MPVTRLSDSTLVRKAQAAEAKKARAAELMKECGELQHQVMEELRRRKTRVIEHNGIKLTRVQTDKTTINDLELMAELKPSQRKLCQKRVFDRAGLQAAVQGGLISVDVVTKHSEVTPNNPYLVVTVVPVR